MNSLKQEKNIIGLKCQTKGLSLLARKWGQKILESCKHAYTSSVFAQLYCEILRIINYKLAGAG